MGIELENGYVTKTTFIQDFKIADKFGIEAVKDTYNRAFNEWKDNLEYVTELCMVMSWSSCYWYEKDNNLSKLYSEYYYKTDEWCLSHFKGKDLEYYLKTID